MLHQWVGNGRRWQAGKGRKRPRDVPGGGDIVADGGAGVQNRPANAPFLY